MAGALELLEAAHDEREAHEHLARECRWYQHVEVGGRDHPDAHCRPAPGEPRGLDGGGALVKFTPRTPEASTVPRPTVPPGGPGLWHVKGMQLPPYIQHLYTHLVARYGKEKAYGVAVGVVKKWAAGVNPGGKHPTKTHPDVRAAAAKNVAEWERKRAIAHAQHGSREEHQVAAAAAAVLGGHTPFPGQAQKALPPVPKGAVPGEMFAAHRLDDMLRDLAHANERLRAAKTGKALRGYHLIHVNNHLNHALDGAHAWAASLPANFPAEARELDALTKTIGLAKAVSPDAKVATFAHLLQTILYHLAHSKRHAMLMTGTSPDAVWRFNWDHAVTHSTGASEHCFKMAQHVRDNYPGIARWFNELERAEDPDDPYTGLAAAATAPGARPFLVPAPTGGKYSQYGMYQNPVQAISPSPPLPPNVPLPTGAEVRAVIPLVPESSKPDLSATARKFLEQAAYKLDKDNPLEALGVMRSAQAAMYAAHKADQGELLPSAYTANVFARVPSAAQSSATAAMKQGRDRVMAWRKAEQALGALTDRIRKRYFHGVFSGPSQMARLTEDDDMTAALDRLLALAGAGIVTGKDVSEPTESDTSGAAPLIQPAEDLLSVTEPKAAAELEAMPLLDKSRVNAYLTRARDMRRTNPAGASQFAMRASMIAREAGAHHLARHIVHHVRALAGGANATHAAAVVGRMQAEGRTVSPRNSPQTVADTGNGPWRLSAPA